MPSAFDTADIIREIEATPERPAAGPVTITTAGREIDLDAIRNRAERCRRAAPGEAGSRLRFEFLRRGPEDVLTLLGMLEDAL